MNNEFNRRTPGVLSPTMYDNDAGARDQLEFRYAPTVWSDTESLERGIGGMRINGVRYFFPVY